MARELDDEWVARALDMHEQIEALHAEMRKSIEQLEVTARSPDGLVEIVVAGDGTIREVIVPEESMRRSGKELSAAMLAAIRAAGDAADWARRKVEKEAFGSYRPLSVD